MIVNYIFGNLRFIEKDLKKQAKFNRNVVNFAITTSIYLVVNEYSKRRQDKEINELRTEIAELKRTKGE